MRRFIIWFGLLLQTGTASATEEDWRDCRQFADTSRAIVACGRIIAASPSAPSNEIAEAYTTRGYAYFRNNNVEQAMADYDEGLRRNPNLATAYQYRGVGYLFKHDDDRAIADFNKGIELDPKDVMIRLGRASVYSLKGQVELALADYDAAIAADAKNFIPLLARGILLYYNNAPEKARDDFARAVALSPTDHTSGIWLNIADRRLGLQTQLSTEAKEFDMTRWPAPLVRLFLGEVKPESVPIPEHLTAERHTAMICERDFYAAEFDSLQGNKAEARRLYEQAQQVCPRYFVESVAADAALRSLGKPY